MEQVLEETMLERLAEMDRRYQELTKELTRPEVLADPKAIQQLGREQATLEPTVARYRDYLRVRQQLAEARALIEEERDEELRALAREEIEALQARRATLVAELREALRPRDPNDDRDVIVEIRAGTGGEEASLFAADLFRMYARYAERQGWKVELTPRFEDRQVASIGVRNGATQSLEVKVTTPERIAAGTYPVVVKASSPAGEATLNLNTVVVGTYELRLTTPTGRLNAQGVAGRDSPLKLVVENTGTAELHNITFSSDVPVNWTVKFDPQRIDVLEPGKTREVTATLRPDSRAIAGDYAMTLRAQAAEASTSSTFRVAVQTPTLWGWVGVGIVALVLAGLFGTFRVYGRR